MPAVQGSQQLLQASQAAALEPAGFEHYVELLKQGAGAMQRVAASSRLLQREAHRTHLLSKAALGASYTILDDPERLYTSPDWADMPDRALQANLKHWQAERREAAASAAAGGSEAALVDRPPAQDWPQLAGFVPSGPAAAAALAQTALLLASSSATPTGRRRRQGPGEEAPSGGAAGAEALHPWRVGAAEAIPGGAATALHPRRVARVLRRQQAAVAFL